MRTWPAIAIVALGPHKGSYVVALRAPVSAMKADGVLGSLNPKPLNPKL